MFIEKRIVVTTNPKDSHIYRKANCSYNESEGFTCL